MGKFWESLITEKTRILRDWVPREFDEIVYPKAGKYLDIPIIKEYGYEAPDGDKRWPGKEKYVFAWVILKNNIAIGWNENPAKGWGFPVKKL